MSFALQTTITVTRRIDLYDENDTTVEVRESVFQVNLSTDSTSMAPNKLKNLTFVSDGVHWLRRMDVFKFYGQIKHESFNRQI